MAGRRQRLAGERLADDRRFRWLNGDGVKRALTRTFKVARYAADGAAGANASHQHVQFAVRRVPKLWACGALVDVRVGGVLKLLGHIVVIGITVAKLGGLVNSALHSLCRVGEHELCAECFQHLATFNTHRRRHGKNNSVAARCARKGQCDSGIA